MWGCPYLPSHLNNRVSPPTQKKKYAARPRLYRCFIGQLSAWRFLIRVSFMWVFTVVPKIALIIYCKVVTSIRSLSPTWYAPASIKPHLLQSPNERIFVFTRVRRKPYQCKGTRQEISKKSTERFMAYSFTIRLTHVGCMWLWSQHYISL